LQFTQPATTVSSTQTEDQSSLLEDSSLLQGTSSSDLISTLAKLDEPPVLESSDESGPKTCNCDVKYTRLMAEQRDRLERVFKEDKQKGLDEQSDRVSIYSGYFV